MPDTVGYNYLTALNLGILNDTQTVSDFIGGDDTNDYYQFQVNEDSALSLNLDGLLGDAYLTNVKIYDEYNREIKSASFDGINDKNFDFNLNAGTYYLQVNKSSYSSSTPYNLEISTGPIPDEAGDRRETATEIGLLNDNKIFNDWVGDIDRQDYYKFELSDDTSLSFNVSGLSSRVGLAIFEENNNSSIQSFDFLGTNDEPANFDLNQGSYYAVIQNPWNGSDTSYQLEISSTLIPDSIGNDRNTAKDIGLLNESQTFQERIGSVDPLDYYQFKIDNNSATSIDFAGLNGESYRASVQILDSNHHSVTPSFSFDGVNDKPLNSYLPSGTYYAVVRSIGSNPSVAYQLDLSATEIFDLAGNTQNEAHNLGQLDETQTFSDWVGSLDVNDYYKFDLVEKTNVEIDLNSTIEGQTTKLQLFDSEGRSLLSRPRSTTAINIEKNLLPGTYYTLVSQGNWYQRESGTWSQGEANTTYDFTITPTAIPDLAGNTSETAKDIGNLSDRQIFNDWIGHYFNNGVEYDQYDYYTFSLAEDSSLNFTLTELDERIDEDDPIYINIYDSDDKYLRRLRFNSDDSQDFKLNAGTYYARVETDRHTTPYQLAMSAEAIPDRAGNDRETAREISPLQDSQSFQDWVGNIDSYDYYKFQLDEGGSLNFNLTPTNETRPTSYHRLRIYTEGRDNHLYEAHFYPEVNSYGVENQPLEIDLTPGIYYARVSGVNSSGLGNYNLEIEATTYPDFAGNRFDEARHIGTLSGTQSFSDWIGNVDYHDYYQFELSEDSTLNLETELLELGAKARLMLFDENQRVIVQSQEPIEQDLKAGTYYARVSSSGDNTDYNLKLTTTEIPDRAGNSFSEARNLDILAGQYTFEDFVGNIDDRDYYRFELLENSNFAANLEALHQNVNIALYDRNGRNLESLSAWGTGAGAIERELDAGVYYLKIHQSRGNTEYTLDVSAVPSLTPLPFAITGVTPDSGSNAGQTTITLNGAQFTPNARVSLIDDAGTEIIADRVLWQNENTLAATFDLDGAVTDNYDIVLVDEVGTIVSEDSFRVNNSPEGQLEVFLNAPRGIRPWQTGEVIVTYRNDGETDIVAPLLTLAADGASLQDPATGKFVEESIQVLGIDNDGVAGVLAPGASGNFKVRFHPTTGLGNEIDFTVSTLKDEDIIDWNALENSVRPSNFSDEVWDAVWPNLVDSIGNTAGDYQTVLAENATTLSQWSDHISEVNRLLEFEIQQSTDYFSLPQRYHLGSLGRGWSFIGDIQVSTDSEGHVVIENGDIHRSFQRLGDGSYQSADGDRGTLTKQGETYQIRERDGQVIAFRSDGRLDYFEDANQNRTTAIYTSDRLTRLEQSNGEKIDFTYNSQNRIVSAIDRSGRTTTYTYDTSGEKLLSIITSEETISYTYNDDFAVTSIDYGDGTQRLLEYDDRGRLIRESWQDGSETVTYAYDSSSGVTVTDATGVTTNFVFNELGQIGLFQDALGRTTQFRYDDLGNLTRTIAPDGSIYSFSYDEQGNLIGQIDPDGRRLDLTYDPVFGQLATLTDARGNTLNYTYDDRGNTATITYADNSRETFDYDSQGNLIKFVDHRDRAITYTYNGTGQLSSQELADGSTISYTYDSRGNLASVVDSQGTTTTIYDAADRMTKITYPSGRFLEFSYDLMGRRTQRIDQDGTTVNYSYDNADRLKLLTDEKGDLIVAYDYDAAGRLRREDKGNGTYTTYEYDTAGQLIGIQNYAADGSTHSSFNYDYDRLGRQKSAKTLDGEWTYSYDATGQLTRAIFDSSNVNIPNQDLTYLYDEAGNRIRTITNGITTEYTTNNLNQYTSVGNISYEYDADGNLIKKTAGTEIWNYTYDAEGLLIQVIEPDNTKTEYEYDAFGNRVATVRNGVRTEYLIDPLGRSHVVGEYDTDGTPIAKYTYGLGLESQSNANGDSKYYDFNAVGSTVGITGTTGNLLNEYSYLPFGENLFENEIFPNSFEYIGQWGVMEEANGLDFMRARYYDSKLGRFAAVDPLLLAGGSANFYEYALNNPLSYIDPQGEAAECIDNRKYRRSHQSQPPSYGSGGVFISLFKTGAGIYMMNRYSERMLQSFRNGDIQCFQYYSQQLNRASRATLYNSTNLLGNQVGGSILRSLAKAAGGGRFTQKVANELGGYLGSKPADRGSTSLAISFDPNDIIGPTGFGEEGWIEPISTFPYTIRFENDAEKANAPAVFVTISQQLDTDLDWDSFEVGDFGFGNIEIEVPEGFQNYSERVDLRDTLGYFVDFNAGIDLDTGEVTWTLETIDPETGEYPAIFDAGFLPPNNENHDGEGFVKYRIVPQSTLTTGTTIDAEAAIVFDTNEPIYTPVWTNTADISDPSSRVSALPATVAESEFTVNWSGSDNGSGIATYDVYVAADGGNFELWLEDTPDTSATYTGEIGKTYSFYSIATDNVGHVEAAPTEADATTTLTEIITPPPSIAVEMLVDANGDGIFSESEIGSAGENATFRVAIANTGEETVTLDAISHSQFDIIGSDFANLIGTTLAAGESAIATFNAPLPDLAQTTVGTDNNDTLNGFQDLMNGQISVTATNTVGESITAVDDATVTVDVRDTISGGLGDDIIFGHGADDILRGDRNSRNSGGKIGGDDIIHGGAGNDRIGGKAGNDILFGDEGNDQIWGDDGDDIIRGGLGNDILTGDDLSGGTGRDTFVLAIAEGTDTIVDFEVGEDIIGLTGNLTYGQLEITRQGDRTEIKFGQETLAVLEGVTSTLTRDDFVKMT